MFIKPVGDLLIRDPRTRIPLPKEGAEVPDTGFWRRRLRDQSVETATPPAPTAAEPEHSPAA